MEIVKRTYICNLCKQEIKESYVRLRMESAHWDKARLRFIDKWSHFHHECFKKLFGEQLEKES